MIHSEIEICKDGKVILTGETANMIAELVKGLIIEKKTGEFPTEMEDWECRLANHIHSLACLNDLAPLIIAHFAENGISLQSFKVGRKGIEALMPKREFQGVSIKVYGDQAWLDHKQKLSATDPEFFDKLMGHWVSMNARLDALWEAES